MDTITISKGTHKSLRPISHLVKPADMSKKINFMANCQYQIDLTNQPDWNKLFGYTIGLLPAKGKSAVHYNSIRFGWRYLNGFLEVAPYWYSKGDRHLAETDNLPVVKLSLGQYYDFKISRSGSTYTLSVNGPNAANKSWQIKNMATAIFGWSLNFYFGGDCKAPQDISVMIG